MSKHTQRLARQVPAVMTAQNYLQQVQIFIINNTDASNELIFNRASLTGGQGAWDPNNPAPPSNIQLPFTQQWQFLATQTASPFGVQGSMVIQITNVAGTLLTLDFNDQINTQTASINGQTSSVVIGSYTCTLTTTWMDNVFTITVTCGTGG